MDVLTCYWTTSRNHRKQIWITSTFNEKAWYWYVPGTRYISFSFLTNSLASIQDPAYTSPDNPESLNEIDEIHLFLQWVYLFVLVVLAASLRRLLVGQDASDIETGICSFILSNLLLLPSSPIERMFLSACGALVINAPRQL